MRNLEILIFVTITVGSTGCNPWKLPGFKDEAIRQEERITRETEEAIQKSPALQELNHLCTQEIPRPEGFLPINKYRDLHGERFLGYGYQSQANYQSVKTFYIDYFTRNGWHIVKEKDGGWGPSEIEFSKDKYQVTVSDVVGGKRINYFLHCEKVGAETPE